MADSESRIRITAVNATQRAFNEIKRSMQEVEGTASGLRNALLGLGTGLSLGGLVAFAKSGIDAADNLEELAQKVGVSVESLSAFNFVAKFSGISADTLSQSLARLARAASEAQGGTGETAEAFRALGIAVTNSSGQLKSTEDLLLDVAEQFAGIEDGAGKTALAMRLFGRSGAELIPLLNQGRAGFEAFRAEAERLGLIISTQTAKAAAEFNDNLTRINASAEALKIQIANGLLPGLNRFVNELLEGNRISGGFLESLRLFGTINPFRTLGDNIKTTREELDKLTAARERYARSNSDTRGIDQAIAAEQRRLEFLKFQQRQEALALGAGIGRDERQRFGGVAGGRPAPTLSVGGGGGGAADTRAENALRQLEDEVSKAQELTRTEEVLAAIQAGRYGKVNEAQRTRLVNLAAEVDLQRESARVQREADAAVAATTRAQDERTRAEAERLNQLAQSYRDILDPLDKFRRQLAEIEDLRLRGLLSGEEAAELQFKVSLDMQQATLQMDGLKDRIRETNDEAREIGLIFQSAASDAIREWEGFGNLIRSIGRDIAQLVLKKTVTDPLGKGISSLIGNINFASLFGGARAQGGPVSSGKAYLVGEQGPELFVPGASGNIIPNGAMGAGTVINQTINFAANTPAAVRDAVFALAPQLQAASVAAVRADRNRRADAR
jgi:hypothetical protein